MEKHVWSRQEDRLCCLACYVYAMEGKGDDVRPLYEELCEKLPHIKPSSFHMKIRNIKQLFMEHNVEYTFNISPLSQYSIQCEEALLDILYMEQENAKKA